MTPRRAPKGDAPDAEPVPEVPRTQVLAHRVRAQGLDRATADAADLGLVNLGVQDTPAGSAAVALAARLPDGAEPALDDGRSWASVWAVRGAPHVHRKGDLATMAAALWPADADDAAARLAGTGSYLRKEGVDALDALRVTAEAVAEVVTEQMPKGEVSTAVTPLIPEACVSWCRSCEAHHLSDQLLRLASLPGGARLVVGERTATLAPIAGWDGVPEAQTGTEAVIDGYLRAHGPATAADVAAYLQTNQKALRPHWPDDLEEVRVDGRRTWLPADQLDALLDAPAPRLTRLLPRGDPWLLSRDRELTVPDAAHRKALWPVLGAPGALLVDGEVAGIWRTRAAGRRLALTVTPFGSLSRRVRAEVDDEADRVGAARHADRVEVAIEG